VIVLGGLAERILCYSAWRAVPIRIHVNGTRGKSTVTRLIHTALRGAGIPAIARCTGTAARLLLPDGSERGWPRQGRPNIREIVELLRLARRLRVRAAVIECMAIHPELQWTVERDMVRATIGVITNVRADHAEVMGKSLEQVAASLANTIPQGAVLVTGDTKFESFFRERAGGLGTRHVSSPVDLPGKALRPGVPHWLRRDQGLALAVTRELGISDDVALAAMTQVLPDPGAVGLGRLSLPGCELPCLDATAANDPESLEQIVREWSGTDHSSNPAGLLVVYNHRADRPERLRSFAEQSECLAGAAEMLVTGDRPALILSIVLRRLRGGHSPRFVPSPQLLRAIYTRAPSVKAVLFCGNTQGLDVAALMGTVDHG
jgi:poly-gamma-glutamate synthase PgsB/CapB